MMPEPFNRLTPLFKTSIIAMIVFSFFYAQVANADITIATLVQNLANVQPQFMRLVTALSYVLGMFFIFNGILKLKRYGEQRTMMSSDQDIKEPLLYIIIGAALLYLPSSVWVGMQTLWQQPTPYSYEQASGLGIGEWHDLLVSVFRIVQLIGTIAFVRGLIIMSHLGSNSQQGTFGRGMSHIVGGILCINIYQFTQAVINTFGLGQI